MGWVVREKEITQTQKTKTKKKKAPQKTKENRKCVKEDRVWSVHACRVKGGRNFHIEGG